MSEALFLTKSYPYLIALLFGVIPASIWTWFWLKEDEHPEPNKLIIFSFLFGMLAVLIALPLQRFINNHVTSNTIILFILWAGTEEILKFIGAFAGGIDHKADDEPIDPIIYMIVTALGFVAMENTLFLIDPLLNGNGIEIITTGGLRFMGATLLHVMTSSVVGVFLALAFYKERAIKILYGVAGLILAIILHTYFNLFIMDRTGGNIFLIFGCVWAGIIFLMLLFEKIKHSVIKH